MTMRGGLLWLSRLALLIAALQAAPGRAQNDQGIGGTGAPVVAQASGAGFYGAIAGFGSIVVNGHKIEYSAATPLFVDGKRTILGALRVGQIVQVVGFGETPKARRITIDHIVIGAVASVTQDQKSLVVLGQRVLLTDGLAAPNVGERIAVDGLRRPDGTIVARLISAAAGKTDQIVGPLSIDSAGKAEIFGLTIQGPKTASRVGARVVVRGIVGAEGLLAASIRDAPLLPHWRGVSTWVVDSYYLRQGQDVVFGDGLRAPADAVALNALAAASGEVGHALIMLSVSPSGALLVSGVAHAVGPPAPAAPPALAPPPHGPQGHPGGPGSGGGGPGGGGSGPGGGGGGPGPGGGGAGH